MTTYIILKTSDPFLEPTPDHVFTSKEAARHYVWGKHLEGLYETLSILADRVTSWYDLPALTQIDIYEMWWPVVCDNYYIEEISLD